MRGPLMTSYPDYLTQLARLLADPVYRGQGVVQGKGQPVLLIPGFLAGDWSLLRMAGWLNRLGYRSYFSGIDWNVDCPNTTATKLAWRLEQLTTESVGPLAVIGHSLGGLLARFLGTNFPVQVCHVIALGSPLEVSTPEHVHPMVHAAFRLLTPLRQRGNPAFRWCGSPSCTCRFAKTAFARLPSGVTLTSIFSKQDAIVDGQASVDPEGENIAVSGGHFGLVVNREVYRAVASTLAIRFAEVSPASASL